MSPRNRLRFVLVVLAILTLAGCFGSKTPMVPVKYYTIEYPPPPGRTASISDAVIRVEQFAASRDYDGRDMISRPRPFVREAYRNHRWSEAPVDMVRNFLLRDIRQSGLFRAALSPGETGVARYRIDGQVEEFLEIESRDRPVASLAIAITLTDTATENPDAGILLQKTYRTTEVIKSKNPGELARGLSAAMAGLSGALLGDIAAVMKKDRARP